MVTEAIFLGILLGFIYYEFVGLTPGGIIVPGYVALYLGKPLILASTLAVVLITYFIVNGLGHIIILYGRRAFLAAVITGFLLKWSIETYFFHINSLSIELEVIGYIIPGLIASEMRKQGIWQTVASLAIVSSVVNIIMRIQQYL
jgi:poly-gamma-glutamate biosynthesis protein PgsC/CapC